MQVGVAGDIIKRKVKVSVVLTEAMSYVAN